jgi:predicted lysophospholipase L1 biosynthesis ABC-type transport system permease subunit
METVLSLRTGLIVTALSLVLVGVAVLSFKKLHERDTATAKQDAIEFLTGDPNTSFSAERQSADFTIGPETPGILRLKRLRPASAATQAITVQLDTGTGEYEVFPLRNLEPEGKCRQGRQARFFLLSKPRNEGENVNDWIYIQCYY